MNESINYPIYRKVKDKKIYIEINDDDHLISVGLDFGRKGRCHYSTTKNLADIPKPIRTQLYEGSGEYRVCTKQEFLAAYEYAATSSELIKS